jgi:hypothetical protein
MEGGTEEKEAVAGERVLDTLIFVEPLSLKVALV